MGIAKTTIICVDEAYKISIKEASARGAMRELTKNLI